MTDQPASLAAALALLQTRLPDVAKGKTASVTSNRTGRTHTYDYADLYDVTRVLLPILGELGLSFIAAPTMHDRPDGANLFVLAYQLMHVSGESKIGYYPLPASGSPQEIGSAITYARRYALCAVTGLAPGGDDDDARQAEDAHPKLPRNVPDADLAAAGRMTRAEKSAHERHAASAPSPPATRGVVPMDDDPWAGMPAEERPGSAGPDQLLRIGILFRQLGLDQDNRHAYVADFLGTDDPISATDLSMVDASRLMAEIAADLAKKEIHAAHLAKKETP